MGVTQVEGWSCANCGAWVSMNKSHTCPTNQITGSSYSYVTYFDWSRVMKLLEQIAEDLRYIKNKI